MPHSINQSDSSGHAQQGTEEAIDDLRRLERLACRFRFHGVEYAHPFVVEPIQAAAEHIWNRFESAVDELKGLKRGKLRFFSEALGQGRVFLPIPCIFILGRRIWLPILQRRRSR